MPCPSGTCSNASVARNGALLPEMLRLLLHCAPPSPSAMRQSPASSSSSADTGLPGTWAAASTLGTFDGVRLQPGTECEVESVSILGGEHNGPTLLQVIAGDLQQQPHSAGALQCELQGQHPSRCVEAVPTPGSLTCPGTSLQGPSPDSQLTASQKPAPGWTCPAYSSTRLPWYSLRVGPISS